MQLPFDIPRRRVLAVDAVDIRLESARHPFERDNIDAINVNWTAETAANPALFDGEVVLLSSLSFRQGSLIGRCHPVRYATFLYWRRLRPVPSAEHIFAHPMLVANDNALVAIRSGGHTVNAGLVYFAAGSFEPCDFPDGEVDLDHNMHREVEEETGLHLSRARREPRLYVVSGDTGTVIFRRYRFDCSAGELAMEIDDYARRCVDSEIDGAVVIDSADHLPAGTAPHMPLLIQWHFSSLSG